MNERKWAQLMAAGLEIISLAKKICNYGAKYHIGSPELREYRQIMQQAVGDEDDPHSPLTRPNEAQDSGIAGGVNKSVTGARAPCGETIVRPIGPAALIDIRGSIPSPRAGLGELSRWLDDGICLHQQVSGQSWFRSVGVKDFRLSAGGMALTDGVPPFAAAPIAAGFHLRILKIPRRDADWRGAAARPLAIDKGLGALLSSCFSALVAEGPHLTNEQAELALGVLARLALATGQASRSAARLGDASPSTLLRAAHEMIERQIDRPDLSPSTIATKLGVSLRQLHYLFEPTGASFSRYVTLRRLERARRLLREAEERSVADVAFACGFESSATFHRLFRDAHGTSPGNFRRSPIAPS
jgi:AraC-like DNA-binding protein